MRAAHCCAYTQFQYSVNSCNCRNIHRTILHPVNTEHFIRNEKKSKSETNVEAKEYSGAHNPCDKMNKCHTHIVEVTHLP